MQTWYCVTTAFDDHGRVTAGITNIRDAEEKPESSFTETRRKDIYNDWYASEEEARSAVEEAKRA